jgi:hypothetical protein
MTDIELIQHTVSQTLIQLGHKPRQVKKYMGFNEALRFLAPVGIGRRRLERLIETGIVRVKDKDYTTPNSPMRIYAEDIYKLLNN